MVEYSSKVKKRMETMKLDTLHDVYIKAFISLFILGTIAIALRSDTHARTLREIMVNLLGGGSFILFLSIIKIKVKSFKLRYSIYLVASIMYSVATAMITSDDYLTTSGIGLVVFAVLIFFSFSQSHLIIYILVVALIIGLYTWVGIGQEVQLTSAYPVSAVGSFLVLGYILIRGARLFREYEATLYDKIDELDEKNMELAAFNEEFKATEEEIMSQYDEINDLNTSLAHSNAQTKAIVNATEDAFIGYNPVTKVFEFSSNVKALLNLNELTMEDNLPQFLQNLDESNRNEVSRVWQSLLSGEVASEVIDIKYPIIGDYRDFQLTFLSYKEKARSKQLVIAIKDITDLKKNERLEHWKIYHDEMTGLLNRNGFIHEVDRLFLKKELDFYVILFDVDDFKYINTSFGYSVGDKFIGEIANRLGGCKKTIQHFAHLDGDSFIMTVRDSIDVHEAILDLEKTIDTISIDGVEFNITCSVGIGEIEDATTATALIRKAELAMYEAKSKGKKQHAHYSDAMNALVSRQYKIIQALEMAINNEEMYLVYQPKVATDSNKIIGFESLVRWQSAELGFVGPMEFIDLAEKTGQIIDLGEYIMSEAMIFAKEAAQLDNSVRVSINISTKQLIEKNFVERVVKVIETTGVKVENLGFEVTETSYIGNMQKAEDTLKQISDLGIKVYLDDFGTGYSSLAYLDRLPIDFLKIDKSFIDEIHLKERSIHMLSAIIGLSQSLGIECIAEGVELKEQEEILKDKGCEIIQGYYFDRPLPREEALDKVAHIYKKS